MQGMWQSCGNPRHDDHGQQTGMADGFLGRDVLLETARTVKEAEVQTPVLPGYLLETHSA